MLVLKVRKIGKSRGVVLPKEALARLGAGEGGRLLLIETPDGGYRIAPCNAVLERQIALAERGTARYGRTLRALAD